MPYGAFVEILPGKDGLVHISELSEDPSIRVARVEDVRQRRRRNHGDGHRRRAERQGQPFPARRADGELPEPKPERPPRRDGDRGDRPPRRDDRGFRGGPGGRIGEGPPRRPPAPRRGRGPEPAR